MYTQEITVKNEVGLHARPATYFIQKANEFKCGIWVEKDERRVNAKSLLGVLSLGIVGGTTITLIADGSDEKGSCGCAGRGSSTAISANKSQQKRSGQSRFCFAHKGFCRVRRQQAAVYGRLCLGSAFGLKKMHCLTIYDIVWDVRLFSQSGLPGPLFLLANLRSLKLRKCEDIR